MCLGGIMEKFPTEEEINQELAKSFKLSINSKNLYRNIAKNYFNALNGLVINDNLENTLSNLFNDSQIYSILQVLRFYYSSINKPIKLINQLYTKYNNLTHLKQVKRIEKNGAEYPTLQELINFNNTLPMNNEDNMNLKLFIAMYTLIPPLRRDYTHIKLIIDNSYCEYNFINIQTKEAVFYSQKTQKVISYLNPDFLPDKLINIIRDSYQFQPRAYLFTKQNDPNAPYKSSHALYVYLMKLLNKYYPKMNINAFRHIYTTATFYLKRDQKNKIANNMAHSIETHNNLYGFNI